MLIRDLHDAKIANVWNPTGNTNNGDASNVFLSGNFAGNKTYNFNNSNHTIGIYATNFTGNVFASKVVWVLRHLLVMMIIGQTDILGNVLEDIFSKCIGPIYYNFTGNFNYIRFKYLKSRKPGTFNKNSFFKKLNTNIALILKQWQICYGVSPRCGTRWIAGLLNDNGLLDTRGPVDLNG